MPKHSCSHVRHLLAAAAIGAGLAAGPALGDESRDGPECRFEAQRTVEVDATDAERLEVVARAGELVVEGVPGATDVRARGHACASTEDLLEEIQLSGERRGAAVRVEALVPERDAARRGYARLDLVLEAPAGLAANIDDSSGPMELERLGALTIVDSSGEIEIEDASGSVRIHDSSGAIELTGVRGDVDIDDSSGAIEVRDGEGSVEVSDSSGEIVANGIRGSVIVHRDSSGAIRVADLGGDFVVESDTSGGVSYRDVAGAVRVPRDD